MEGCFKNCCKSEVTRRLYSLVCAQKDYMTMFNLKCLFELILSVLPPLRSALFLSGS